MTEPNEFQSFLDSDDETSQNITKIPNRRVVSRTGQFPRSGAQFSRVRQHGSSSPPTGRHSPQRSNGRSSPSNKTLENVAMEESMPMHDPRRFTPSLHANLVAEILSLRRDLESRQNIIELLENDLLVSKSEVDAQNSSVAIAAKEVRDAQRMLALIENDSALNEVTNERDEAQRSANDLRRQIDRLGKAKRTAESDIEKMRLQMVNQKDQWETSKRSLELRVHSAENRLNTVLQEVAAMQRPVVDPLGSPRRGDSRHSSRPSTSSAHGFDIKEIKSRHSRSNTQSSARSSFDDEGRALNVRFSLINADISATHSLADELQAFDEEDEEEEESDTDQGASRPGSGSIHNNLLVDRTSLDTTRLSTAETNPPSIRASSDIVDYYATSENAPDISDQIKTLTSENDKLTKSLMDLEALFQAEQQSRLNLEYTSKKQQSLLEEQYNSDRQTWKTETETIKLEREELLRQHQRQTEILEILAVENQHQMELLTVQRMNEIQQKRFLLEAQEDMELSIQVDSIIQDIIENILEDQSLPVENVINIVNDGQEDNSVRSKDSRAEATPLSPPNRLVSFIEGGRFPEFVEEENVKEIAKANQRRKRISSSYDSAQFHSKHASVGSQNTLSTTTPTNSIVEKIHVGCQTDPPTPPPTPPAQVIPSIEIHPPTTPTKTKTSDACCQTDVGHNMTTASMQTEQITIDRRNLPPQLQNIQSAVISSTSNSMLPPVPPLKSEKRAARSTTTTETNTSPHVSPTSLGNQVLRVIQEKKKQVHSSVIQQEVGKRTLFKDFSKPPRTSSLFGTDGASEDEDEYHEFANENDFKTVLSAPKYTKFRSNIHSSPPAMSRSPGRNHRIRKDTKPTYKIILDSTQSQRLEPKSAVINAHQTTSFDNILTGPPFPVPSRHSSKNLPPSVTSSRASSPSPMSRDGGHRRSRSSSKQIGGPRLKRINGELQISTPPPRTSSSTGPQSPMDIPPLPQDVVLMPFRSSSRRNTVKSISPFQGHHAGSASIDSTASREQPSVVDAMAQTMVGEWMWKYVRRRKSFGVPESPQGWESKEEGNAGVRHKRWVWIAPYQGMIMWSSRQPTSGSALLGKAGRKLIIQSVLDVRDDTPLPRGAQALFNRSILILTPARALKFTTTSPERHYVWLTALSFLSQPSEGPKGGLTLPVSFPSDLENIPEQNSNTLLPSKSKSSSFFSKSRGGSRDHSSNDHTAGGSNASTTSRKETTSVVSNMTVPQDNNSRHLRIESNGSLDFPSVPRHGRKRSNTYSAPRLPTIRHASNPVHGSFNADNIQSVDGALQNILNQSHTLSPLFLSTKSSHTQPDSTNANFFEAVPMIAETMRMEAFVDTETKYSFDETEECANSPPLTLHTRSYSRSGQGGRKGFVDYYGGSGTSPRKFSDDLSPSTRVVDPFKGF